MCPVLGSDDAPPECVPGYSTLQLAAPHCHTLQRTCDDDGIIEVVQAAMRATTNPYIYLYIIYLQLTGEGNGGIMALCIFMKFLVY